MTSITLHSKLIDLQGQTISNSEEQKVLTQLRTILQARKSGQLSIAEAGTRIRRVAWKVAEDLCLNGLALGAGSDQALVEHLPEILDLEK